MGVLKGGQGMEIWGFEEGRKRIMEYLWWENSKGMTLIQWLQVLNMGVPEKTVLEHLTQIIYIWKGNTLFSMVCKVKI